MQSHLKVNVALATKMVWLITTDQLSVISRTCRFDGGPIRSFDGVKFLAGGNTDLRCEQLVSTPIGTRITLPIVVLTQQWGGAGERSKQMANSLCKICTLKRLYDRYCIFRRFCSRCWNPAAVIDVPIQSFFFRVDTKLGSHLSGRRLAFG